LRHRLYTGQK